MIGWRWAFFGIGVVVGALGTAIIANNRSGLREGVTAALGHGLSAKRKMQTILETAKENMEDMVAEADQKMQSKQQGSPEEA